MRALIQRVLEASVSVDGNIVSSIGPGMLIFLGAMQDDSERIACDLAGRIQKFRIFEDDSGKMNLSIADVAGQALVVSQFTLCADLARGNRPSFGPAAEPEKAESLYRAFIAEMEGAGITVRCGIFGVDMKVSLVNDGPVTFILEEPRKR